MQIVYIHNHVNSSEKLLGVELHDKHGTNFFFFKTQNNMFILIRDRYIDGLDFKNGFEFVFDG